MPKFTQLLKEAGVDSPHNFMVVGLRGSNLVGLHDAKGFDLRFDHSLLEVRQLTREQFPQVSNTLYDQFIAWNLINEDSAKAFLGTMHTNVGPRSRLLLVTGRMRGLASINAVHAGITFKLEVAVVPSQNFTVAFKFLQHPDESGNISTTRLNPSDARWLINKLNWIYGPQANISFEMVEADWVKVDKILGESLNKEAFLNHIVERKNKSADLNIFFVRKWKGGEAGGTHFPEEEAVVVEENPKSLPVVDDADPFLVNLAHEVAHYLGADHHDRENVLLSRGRQSTRLDRGLVLAINPP